MEMARSPSPGDAPVADALDACNEWYQQLDLSRYRGQWVSVVDGEVVASDEDLSAVIQATKRRAPDAEPFVFNVPEGTVVA